MFERLGHKRDASAIAFQEVAKKPLLQCDAVIGIEMRPMFAAVALKPFLLRGCSHEAFEIAARMEALSAPVGSRE